MVTPEGAVPVTVSMGVAIGGASLPFDEESLLRTADEALYRAKNTGRNRVVVIRKAAGNPLSPGQDLYAEKVLVER